ncbi:DNA-directed DNA polymerase II small subunit [Candidatus Bathyarchaeota archaeon]|nr:DNA-directed DNA polymerase II small subunit [Candidatus Bathyarchaeota archaeon]
MNNLRKVIQLVAKQGYQIGAESLIFLQSLSEDEAEEVVKEALKIAEEINPKPIVINEEILEAAKKKIKSKTVVNLKTKIPVAKEFESRIEIIKDPTNKITSTGSIEEFNQYFKDRFNKLKGILQQRIDCKSASTLSQALQSPLNSKVKFVAMIIDKREKKDKIILKVDDEETSGAVIIFKERSREVYETAQSLVLDQVVCIEGTLIKDGLIVAENIIHPDLPEKKREEIKEEISVALLADLHCGSKNFLKETFERFLLWLNGEVGSEKQKELAGQVKYIIIAGDLIDGVGVYPEQEEELEITNIYRQYEVIAEYLKEIPDYINILIIPGNHDAVRQALPQPAIPKEFMELINEDGKVISIGNPSEVKLHEVSFLIYHGTSLNDIISSVPKLNYEKPEKALEFLLKIRHLAPIYGANTPISPEKEDYLVVDEAPDIFVAGHTHVAGCEKYKGTMIISCGTWQAQTGYQKKLNVKPTPGILSLIKLDTMQVNILDFSIF